MGLRLKFSTVLKSTRPRLVIFAASLLLAFGCDSGTDRSVKAPEPIPSIHPGGTPPPPSLPANVSSPGVAIPGAGSNDTITAALAEREMFARVRRLADVLETLGPEGVKEAKRALKFQIYHMGGAENVLLARYWGLHEPAEAAHWAFYQSKLGYRLAVTLATVELWAMVDPLAVALELNTLRKLPGFNTVAVEIALIEGWFLSKTPGLVEYIRGLGVGADRQRLLRHLARVTIEYHGPEAAIAWAVSLPEDEFKFKLNAFRQLGKQLGKTHPQHGVAFCDAHCNTPYGNSGLRKDVAQGWAGRDGVAAMEWVKHAPEGQQKLQAVKGAWRGWSIFDMDGLFVWLDAMGPDGIEPGLRDLLTLTAVQAARSDPLRGLAWAEAILEPGTRESTMSTIAKNWRRKDPSSAEAWLLVSPLSEVSRNRVRSYEIEIPDPAAADEVEDLE